MRALLQRVSEASVTVDDEVVGRINSGLLVLLAVQPQDTAVLAEKLVHKIVNYRIFADTDGKMNRSVLEQGGGILWVSQFTLAADTRKGLRPSFTSAAAPGMALELFNQAVECSRRLGVTNTQTGRFGADMKVALVNDGPVTIWLEL